MGLMYLFEKFTPPLRFFVDNEYFSVVSVI